MYIDSHLHLNNHKYKEAVTTVSEMISSAKILGVEKFITVATNTSEFEEITQLSEEFPEIYHTLGIYPTEDFGMKLNDLENLIINHINKKTVAIGECGFNQPIEENQRNIKSQRSLFEMQLDLATRRNLPIVIHNRNSDAETLEVLDGFKNKNLRGVIHCFVSDYAFAKKVLDLGLYLSFNGIVTYKNSINLHETIKNIPLDRMILETDAPYLTPDKFRSELNEPKFIPLIAEKISEIRGVELKVIEQATYLNTLKLFDKIK